MKIVLEKYNAGWKNLFQKEKELLGAVFKNSSAYIEHIGSTSVEDLSAKPIIDILIGIPDFTLAISFIPSIEKLNYEYVSQYEDMMPYRRFFTKDKHETRTHHIHLVQHNSDFWKRHIFFRDYLRNYPETRNEYSLLKKKLSEQEWQNRNEYSDAKTAFIRKIEKRAGL